MSKHGYSIYETRPKHHLRRAFLVFLALVTIALGGLGLHLRTNTPPQHATVSHSVVTTASTEPSEAPIVDACAQYNTPAAIPRRIIIPKLSVDTCVEQMGVTKTNNIATPTNINLTGWFTRSAVPGAAGVSLIDAHVIGRYADGVFKHLYQLSPHDTITIEYGDRSTKQFEVTDVTSYSVDDAAKYQLQQRDGIAKQLNLITCGGAYRKELNGYDQRVIVVSRLVDTATTP